MLDQCDCLRQIKAEGQEEALRLGLFKGHINHAGTTIGRKCRDSRKMRTYLVVIDETPEAETALRFAARRASKTGGAVEILVVMPKQDFLAWGSVQATIEDEAREQAESVITRALDTLDEENAARPKVNVQSGTPIEAITQALTANPDIAALVLGAAASGTPGPLVAHFAGAGSASLPCPVMIVPGGLTREALDRLS